MAPWLKPVPVGSNWCCRFDNAGLGFFRELDLLPFNSFIFPDRLYCGGGVADGGIGVFGGPCWCLIMYSVGALYIPAPMTEMT